MLRNIGGVWHLEKGAQAHKERRKQRTSMTDNDGEAALAQGVVKSNGCRGGVGKRRPPRLIKRHVLT